MKDKVRLGQARLGYVRFLDEFESPGLPGSLKKIIRVIEYFKIEYFGITTLEWQNEVSNCLKGCF
jgi:hypothetical protein